MNKSYGETGPTNGRTLVVGGQSKVGRVLVQRLNALKIPTWKTTRRLRVLEPNEIFLNLARDISGWELPSREIDVAVLCSSVTNIGECRANPGETAIVNVINTKRLIDYLFSNNVFVVFLSTNLVYDGVLPHRVATDRPCPTTEYGRQKAEIESWMFKEGSPCSVIRFTKILTNDTQPIKDWIRKLRDGQSIEAFSDMSMAPVSVIFAVEVIYRVITSKITGIMQVSGREDVPYSTIASHIAKKLGAHPGLIKSVQRASLAPSFVKETPRFTTLDNTRLTSTFKICPGDIWDVLDSTFEI